MSQKFTEDGFKWVEKTSQFSEQFIKNYNKDSSEGYFLEVDVQYIEELYKLSNDLLFCMK